MDFSGGLEGGSDPPAFQRAERERQALAAAEENDEPTSVSIFSGWKRKKKRPSPLPTYPHLEISDDMMLISSSL